jgi:hypothetical protein
MRKEFKVGDRVRSFAVSQSGAIVIKDGVIDRINPSGYMILKPDVGLLYVTHIKQCRRLVKKARGEIWVNFYSQKSLCVHSSKQEADEAAAPGRIACIRYIKAKERK